MLYRCDGAFDCKDKSDEELCDVLMVERGLYNKNYPPKRQGKPVVVKVYLSIRAIQNIKEIDMVFDTKFTITLEWFDERLHFSNLKDGHFTNFAKPEKISKIWIPPLILNNTKKDIMISRDKTSVLSIKKIGKPTMSSHTEVHEDFFFRGDENLLLYRMNIETTCNCIFNLHYYPFDKQTCEIQVVYCIN